MGFYLSSRSWSEGSNPQRWQLSKNWYVGTSLEDATVSHIHTQKSHYIMKVFFMTEFIFSQNAKSLKSVNGHVWLWPSCVSDLKVQKSLHIWTLKKEKLALICMIVGLIAFYENNYNKLALVVYTCVFVYTWLVLLLNSASGCIAWRCFLN